MCAHTSRDFGAFQNQRQRDAEDEGYERDHGEGVLWKKRKKERKK